MLDRPRFVEKCQDNLRNKVGLRIRILSLHHRQAADPWVCEVEQVLFSYLEFPANSFLQTLSMAFHIPDVKGRQYIAKHWRPNTKNYNHALFTISTYFFNWPFFGGLSAPLVTPPKVDPRVAKLQLLQKLQQQLQNLVHLRDLQRKVKSSTVPIVGYLSGQLHVYVCIYSIRFACHVHILRYMIILYIYMHVRMYIWYDLYGQSYRQNAVDCIDVSVWFPLRVYSL